MCIKNFYIQFNSFMGDFKHLSTKIKHKLFISYCTAFYGVQFLPVYKFNCMYGLCVAWRTAMKKVLGLPRLTHSKLIPLIANVLPPELMFEKRSIKFVNKLLYSKNKTVKMIAGMGLVGTHSVVGKNYNYLMAKYNMSVNDLYSSWKAVCQQEHDLIKRCDQINELIVNRDSFEEYFPSRYEAKEIIDFLCTE